VSVEKRFKKRLLKSEKYVFSNSANNEEDLGETVQEHTAMQSLADILIQASTGLKMTL